MVVRGVLFGNQKDRRFWIAARLHMMTVIAGIMWNRDAGRKSNQALISECLHTTSTQPYERRGPERGSPSNFRPGLGGRQDSRFGSSPACYLAPLELNWKSSSYKRFSRLSQPGISPKPPSRSP